MSTPGLPPHPPPHSPAYSYHHPPRTNSYAVASMIVSLVGLLVCPLIGAIGIYLGNRARAEVSKTGEQGDGMALAGIIVGWIGVALTVFIALLIVGWFALLSRMVYSMSTP